jgi:DNA polymerase-3 subunit beta
VKITITQQQLAAVTAWVTARAGKTAPGMLLTAGPDGALSAAGSGYQVSATATAGAETGEPGRALVHARMLAEVAAILPAGRDVTLTTDGTRVTLTAGTAAYRLMLLPADEFPALPAPGEPVAEFAAAWLAAAVTQAVTAAARDDTLPSLTCVQVTLDGHGTATLAATDRYRLAIAACPYTAPGSDGSTPDGDPSAPVLIPARELAAATRRPGSATVTLALPGGTAAITAPGRQVTMRLMDGEFPRWATLIPDGNTVSARVTAELPVITGAVKRAAITAEKNTPVRLAVTGGEIRLESGTGDEAGYAETIPARLDGDPASVSFNPRYLLDTLGAVAATGATGVRIGITTPGRPALITPDGAPDSPVTCRHILMPIRNAG